MRQYTSAQKSGGQAVRGGDYAAAIGHFKRCLALKPSDPVTQYNLCCAHALAGRRDSAVEWLGRACADGLASVRRGSRRVATLGPGDFLGEMSLITGTPRSATVTAETDMVLEILNRREFSSLLDENPTVARKVMVSAVKRLQEVVGDPIA